MAKEYHIHLWKRAPLLRLLLPLIAGIILEYYGTFSIRTITGSGMVLIIAFLAFSFLPEAKRYQLRVVQGAIISCFLIVLGSFFCWQKDIRNHYNWYGKYDRPGSYITATLLEPPVEKAKSYKALASVETIANKDTAQNVTGKILIYLAKDAASKKLKYGDKIILRKQLALIKNTGNPNAFDYARYCAFRQIFHQVYLKENEWTLLPGNHSVFFNRVIFNTRDYILKTLDQYIAGAQEASLAKALLIGYRIDLDKDLVQAYSNVGVVHLIAISGMHLALIYYLLLWIFAKIPFVNKSKFTRLIFVLFCLWFFSLLTGAPASVLRSAVMFTFIAVGDSVNKRNSIYNSLASSAFILLCYDPFMLWDVGFQLSYFAVLGIVIFRQPVYQWFYFKNKILKAGWKLASVSIAAQLFTLPACIYYFHQFPWLFLLSNMIAIPLSTVALWGCIVVIAFSPIPLLALYLGKVLWAFIWLLNHSILLINSIPFSLWKNLSISLWAALILYFIFASIAYWLINNNKAALKIALVGAFIFSLMLSYKNWQTYHQKKIIVYNIPTHRAIDFIQGSQYHFVADGNLSDDPLLFNYNIEPAHLAMMLQNTFPLPGIFYQKDKFYHFYHTKLLILDTAVNYCSLAEKIKLDYIIISKNPPLNISSLSQVFDCKWYVFDSSNSWWKIEKWKKECEELHLHFHSVSEQGAFVINL